MVVLLLTMLTGIGLFAVRSAVLSTSSSGHARQMTQTHYVAEYATLVSAAELSTEKRDSYIKLMSSSPDCPANSPACKCKGLGGGALPPGVLPPNGVSNRTCYVFGYQDMEAQLTSNNKFVIPTDASTPTQRVPGSLGHGDLGAGWTVEMSDLAPATPPVAGTDLSSAGAAQVQYMAVTMSATGEVHPRISVTTGVAQPASQVASSVEQARAHLIVGPLPKL